MENYRLFKLLRTVAPTGVDTSDATATADDIREGKAAYAQDQKVEGKLNFTHFNEYIDCFNLLSMASNQKLSVNWRLFKPNQDYLMTPTNTVDIIMLSKGYIGQDDVVYSFQPLDQAPVHEIELNEVKLTLAEATANIPYWPNGLPAATDYTDADFALEVGIDDNGKEYSDVGPIFKFNVYIADGAGTEITIPYHFRAAANY